jgi:catechol-2,3-dioxygenase
MVPSLEGIDHIHINVSDRTKSEGWYNEVLGLCRVRKLAFWAVDGGPLTLADASGTIHVALFESNDAQRTTIALRTSSAGLAEWIDHLSASGIEVEPIDHEVSWSIYFKDPDGNPFEITSYEYEESRLAHNKAMHATSA